MRRNWRLILVLIVGIMTGAIGGHLATRRLQQEVLQAAGLMERIAGHEHFNNRDFMRAAARFNRAAALDSESFEAVLGLAESYDAMKQTSLALEAYRYALALSERKGSVDAFYIEEIKRQIDRLSRGESNKPE